MASSGEISFKDMIEALTEIEESLCLSELLGHIEYTEARELLEKRASSMDFLKVIPKAMLKLDESMQTYNPADIEVAGYLTCAAAYYRFRRQEGHIKGCRLMANITNSSDPCTCGEKIMEEIINVYYRES